MKIDIGGGVNCIPGWVNLDPLYGEGPFRCRVQDGIPVSDDSVETVHAAHVLEHIPAGQERIDTFNEVWRVLQPGGTFVITVPLFVPGRWEAIADPTHVSFWVKESFDYFTGEFSGAADYGIRPWEMISWLVFDDWEGNAVLRKAP